MAMKAKTFDCVEMKRNAQKALQKEYEARKDEFSSYWDFLAAKADESEWVQKMRSKFSDAQNLIP